MNNVRNCPRDYGKWSCHCHNYGLYMQWWTTGDDTVIGYYRDNLYMPLCNLVTNNYFVQR